MRRLVSSPTPEDRHGQLSRRVVHSPYSRRPRCCQAWSRTPCRERRSLTPDYPSGVQLSHTGCSSGDSLAAPVVTHWLLQSSHTGCSRCHTLVAPVVAVWLLQSSHTGCSSCRTLVAPAVTHWLLQLSHTGCSSGGSLAAPVVAHWLLQWTRPLSLQLRLLFVFHVSLSAPPLSCTLVPRSSCCSAASVTRSPPVVCRSVFATRSTS